MSRIRIPSSSGKGKEKQKGQPSTFSRIIQSNSLFSHAHGFSINNPVMIEQLQVYQEQSRISSALAWLEGHAMSGVEYHSSARAPPPRCHHGTRLRFIEFIQKWFDDPNSKVLWLHGPAGVGKSAISQTIAELLGRKAHLGATIFLSWPVSLDVSSSPASSCDVSAMWLTIAYRLSTTQPAYRNYIADCIENDPKLVEQAMDFQFETLITEPFGRENLINEDDRVIPIIIDGLDQCLHSTQQQIIRLILGFVENYPESPLVWILASRHEMHLTRLFENHKRLGERVQKLFVPVESEESVKDTEIFMRGRFDEMSEEYVALEPIPWPEEEDFDYILVVASGLFILVSAIVSFIGNPHVADPTSQLARVMTAMKKVPPSIEDTDVMVAHIDPLATVHDMYKQILTKLPKPTYHTAKRIIGFYLLPEGFGTCARDSTSFWHLCNILNIKEHIALGCLSQLHSLINVPRRESVAAFPLRFFHQSLVDYLLNREASKEFWIDLNEVVKDLWQCHLRILKETNNTGRSYPQPSQICLVWPNPSKKLAREFQIRAWENARLTFFHHLLPCPTQRCAFGIHLPDAGRDEQMLVDVLAEINFHNIVDGYVCPDMPYRFIKFIHWLIEEHPLLQEKQLLCKLDLPEDNYDWIHADAVSFVIRSVRLEDGGCITTFGAYMHPDRAFLPGENNGPSSTGSKGLLRFSISGSNVNKHLSEVALENGIEITRLFSIREEPKPISELLDNLKLHRAGISDAVVIGSAEVGRCALLVDKSVEDETVYFVLPWKPIPVVESIGSTTRT
ncbi:hypothetical protein D9756_006143 [Leucocoprinus leucothites]|uniref:Nephrocystin 3-like N-terminal domain-containing protein n=1 Tax=Leucocoprinus leucothites TaxID=201217 RepID=A0A8H5D3G4_9AGAR|nr:hypothetical protein D9756_006143 [Leucoagaricus leucothites]